MSNKLADTEVSMDDCDDFHITVHIKGQRIWRLRLWLALQFIKLADLLAPSNINCSVCKECLIDLTDLGEADGQE
jgi:hypothetical protein